jgi:ABC-2 type transport system ATP-binding protein
VRSLRDGGVIIILTTHYIEEAEELADRIGVINKCEIVLVEDKAELMRKLGRKQLTLQLQTKLAAIPPELAAHPLKLAAHGTELVYTDDTRGERTGITTLLKELNVAGIWADNFEKLQVIPLLIITPLSFLGGSFYSIKVLPPVWQTVTLFNPVVT